MKDRLTWVMVPVAFAVAVGGARAQPARDVLVTSGQRYVRTQQIPHNFADAFAPFYAVDTYPGGCAFVACSDRGQGHAFVRHFDRWGNPLHADVDVDPALSSHAQTCRVACHGSDTWVLWEGWYTPEPVGRIFDHLGQAIGPTFSLVPEGAGYFEPSALVVGDDRAAVVVREAADTFDVYARLFSLDGTPLGELLPIATSPDVSELNGHVSMLPDGGQVIGYSTRTWPPPPEEWYGHLRRVHPDQTMDPPELVSEGYVRSVRPRLLSDGTLVVAYFLWPYDTGTLVRRYDASLEPLGEPLALDADLGVDVAVTSDGRLLQAGDESTRTFIWLRLYDASWQPLGERFEPMDEPQPPCRSFDYSSQPVAYDDDGTMWVAWVACNYPLNTYLTTLTPFEPGDMNYDRRVDNFDITPFVMALADPAEYQAHYPGLPYEFLGDVNEDGAFDNFDITPFVQLLTGR